MRSLNEHQPAAGHREQFSKNSETNHITGQRKSTRLVLPHAAEAVDVISKADIRIAGVFVVPISRAEVVGAEPPGAAANHFGFAMLGAAGVLFRTGRGIVHAITTVPPLR